MTPACHHHTFLNLIEPQRYVAYVRFSCHVSRQNEIGVSKKKTKRKSKASTRIRQRYKIQIKLHGPATYTSFHWPRRRDGDSDHPRIFAVICQKPLAPSSPRPLRATENTPGQPATPPALRAVNTGKAQGYSWTWTCRY